mmetsp:Transcript_24856/g.31817  ORF Transcript_24856/g.31817 Transcript_24856/m.31817 type:complete len:224 (+) Transcript_24856:87-758(+)
MMMTITTVMRTITAEKVAVVTEEEEEVDTAAATGIITAGQTVEIVVAATKIMAAVVAKENSYQSYQAHPSKLKTSSGIIHSECPSNIQLIWRYRPPLPPKVQRVKLLHCKWPTSSLKNMHSYDDQMVSGPLLKWPYGMTPWNNWYSSSTKGGVQRASRGLNGQDLYVELNGPNGGCSCQKHSRKSLLGILQLQTDPRPNLHLKMVENRLQHHQQYPTSQKSPR